MLKKFNPDARVLIVTHSDMDGLCSAISILAVYPAADLLTCEFYTIDSKLEGILYENYDYVFVTDIHPTDKKFLDLSDKIILIDHHPSEYHDPSKNRYVVTNKGSAAWLVYRFISNMFPQSKLTHLERLMKLCSDYDTWVRRFPLSTFINELLYGKYRQKEWIARFRDGDVNLTIGEIGYIRRRKNEFVEVFDALEVGDMDKIKGCVCHSNIFINEIADKLLREHGYRIVFVVNPTKDKVSIRHNIDEFDAGDFLDKMEWGGGHKNAAGFFENNAVQIVEKLLYCEEYILKGIADGWLHSDILQ